MFTDEEILAEVAKIQYLYGLKLEIRYNETRVDVSESVAEHIFGMHVLASYFSELEDTKKEWDYGRISEMITWHDMDELETGDMIGYLKTQADKDRGEIAMQTVLKRLPETLKNRIVAVTLEYKEQTTIESRFVKALDKVESLFQLYNANGKEILLLNKTSLEDSRKIKDKYVADFPYLKQFNEVINVTMDKEGFYTKAAL